MTIKNNNKGKPSPRSQFESYRDQKVKTNGDVERFILTPSQRVRANYLWSNKTSNIYKIKAIMKKESAQR